MILTSMVYNREINDCFNYRLGTLTEVIRSAIITLRISPKLENWDLLPKNPQLLYCKKILRAWHLYALIFPADGRLAHGTLQMCQVDTRLMSEGKRQNGFEVHLVVVADVKNKFYLEEVLSF